MSRLEKVATHILVCRHKSCEKAGAREVVKEMRATLKEHGWRRRVMISNVGCLDQCSHAAIVCVYPQGVWYEKVDTETAREIVEEHVIKNRPLTRHLLHDLNKAEDNQNGDD